MKSNVVYCKNTWFDMICYHATEVYEIAAKYTNNKTTKVMKILTQRIIRIYNLSKIHVFTKC